MIDSCGYCNQTRYVYVELSNTMKWHVNPNAEQNPKNIILHCGTNDINDDSDPQNRAEEIVERPNQ